MRRLKAALTMLVVTTLGGACLCAANEPSRETRAPIARRVVALRSPHISARVISTRPMFKVDHESAMRTPAITSGSGITLAGWWLFAAQDDSSLVAAKGTDGSLETIRVFPSVDGADRFMDEYGNKALKPDLEAALTVPVPERLAVQFGASSLPHRPTHEAVLLVGSGSKAVLRDRIALIFPAASLSDSKVVAIHAGGLYEALRREPALSGRGGDLNIEGVALVRGGRDLRLYNRGNGRKGSVVGSVDVALEGVIAYLARAAADPAARFSVAMTNRRVYELGRASDGEPIGITDAISLPPLARAPRAMAGEIRVLSAIAEHTASATRDGHTSDSSLCLELPDGRLLIAPVHGVAGAESLKIEGLSVVSAKWVGRPVRLQINLLAVTDADATDPSTPSTLARIEVTLRAR